MTNKEVGVLEAYVMDPFPRSVGVIMWSIFGYSHVSKTNIDFGYKTFWGREISVASDPKLTWVGTGLRIEGKDVFVERAKLMEIMRRCV